MSSVESFAPGAPGIPARWTSSAKSGIGTALNSKSRVWFTLSHGILNEIYYPEVDQACVRDLGLLVTDGKEFFSEEKRDTETSIENLAAGVPAYRIVNTCKQGRYRIEKDIIADPGHDVVIQRIQFIPLKHSIDEYHLYALLAPHIRNRGAGNTAWTGEFNAIPMLFAERNGIDLAFACNVPWKKRSVGYVGFSDGWQDVMHNKKMTWDFSRTEEGNVALIGEIDLQKSQGRFTLAVGFGMGVSQAGKSALESLGNDFDNLRRTFVAEWEEWQRRFVPGLGETREEQLFYLRSLSVIRTSESKQRPGGIIASLSIPWGFAKGDDDLGGYHLVWTRDLVETAGALLAAGAGEDVLRVLYFLKSTQLDDGHWPQNMWVDGAGYWSGVQMDETAFPILLVDLVYRKGLLKREQLAEFWSMVRSAACYLLMNGPVTLEDRWEEDPG